MVLKSIELSGFKSFAKKTALQFESKVTAIVGPNGSGKSNVVEAIRFVLGEQSMKSLRGKGGTDLIFKGSKDLSALSRASATITFNNKNRIFSFTETGEGVRNVDFDEIRITREVYSDGQNRYLINGSEVRLKDIVELLASVHIGASGHHIISQGEADRILSASNKDRRIMIEDALGLKIYQYRIKESERRLEKTEVNMKEVASLRRELAPHLSFLKKQVEKIEKAEEVRKTLVELYREYFATALWLEESARKEIDQELASLKGELSVLEKQLNESRPRDERISPFEEAKRKVNQDLIHLENKKNTISHEIGRVEGMIDALSRSEKREENDAPIGRKIVEEALQKIKNTLLKALEANDSDGIRSHIQEAVLVIEAFETNAHPEDFSSSKQELETLHETKANLLQSLAVIEGEKVHLDTEKEALKNKETTFFESIREMERSYYELKNTYQEKENQKALLENKKKYLETESSRTKEYMQEGVLLLGTLLSGITAKKPEEGVSEEIQHDRFRQIERLKVKLEESGALGGGETIKEYEDTRARDEFLSRELEDLTNAISETKLLIIDLKTKLDSEFKEGVTSINKAFQDFFATMFGGGSAHLTVTLEQKRKRSTEEEEIDIEEDEEEAVERGIEIHVSLPHKKVRELTMLSGGERSLTSIALLFAMSQVNPPPFLVLDETDAALDEANSRRYGDMIERLSKFSQLILVTHNRETMSRASILFGVTLGADGASKLLSIKFEEAENYAK